MGLYIVTVEAWDQTGNGWYFDVVTLAHTERSARASATRSLTKLNLTGAHSVAVEKVPLVIGPVLIARVGEESILFKAKEATHG